MSGAIARLDATWRVIGIAGLLGCAASHPARRATTAWSDEITLYRDRALIVRVLDVDADQPGPREVTAQLAAGVSDITVLDAGGLTVGELAITRPAAPTAREPIEDPIDVDPTDVHPPRGHAYALDDRILDGGREPTAVTARVTAPRAGHYRLALAYSTSRLRWDAAYTIAQGTPDTASVHGALAIKNTAGLALRGRVILVDTELPPWREHPAERIGSALVAAPPPPAEVQPRDLGALVLAPGERRVALIDSPPRALRHVLVYDPIGTALDRQSATPVADPGLGTGPAPSTVTESLELDRDVAASRGLPAGPARMIAGDGLVAEAPLYAAATRVARVDTIAAGTAEDVVGHRERRGWRRDPARKRLSEELMITLDNHRATPVDVVVREHLYRGQNWTLAYQSVPAVKDGPQQIALRAHVPANGQTKVLYVVVYTW